MPRLSIQENTVPQFSFRYAVRIYRLSSDLEYGLLYAKSISLPKIGHESIEFSTPTSNYSIAGKLKREPLTLALYAYNSRTMHEVMHWMSMHHGLHKGLKDWANGGVNLEPRSRSEGELISYDTAEGQPGWYDDYKLDRIEIELLDESNKATDIIELGNVYVDSIDLGELNYEDDSIVSSTVVLRYEKLKITKKGA